MFLRIYFFCLLFMLSVFSCFAANVNHYLPDGHTYKPELTKPEDLFGFGLGERHIRHDQLLQYFNTLATESELVINTDIGRTTEFRQQLLVTISSPKNLAKLPQLLASKDKQNANQPLIIWLGYSVHGDELSGSNAALVVAYHLAASQSEQVAKILENTVIVLEPSVNPDGMDRFVSWINTHRGPTANADPNHIEHHQGWRTGRTNHFGFDLNRDWLLLSQIESEHRLAYFHQYQPHVLGDFHEMGANSSYFFQPGIPSRTHPLTPTGNIELTSLLATYHAAALDDEQRLYYSEENFDDFYYGKGSTYPDINGSVGILFEQASSRGFQQDTINGLLTFEYGIKNQVLTSLSTIEGAWQHSDKFKQYRQTFYEQSNKAANKEKFSGYLLTETHDSFRFNAFLSKLKQHQIAAYPLTDDFRLDGKVFDKNHSVYVPLAQRQYRVIKALFNQGTNFKDNTFYDVSGWTLPLAMDIDFYKVARTRGLSLAEQPWQGVTKKVITASKNAYAYAFEWHDYLAPKLLNQLLTLDIKAKVATKSFSSLIDGKTKNFAKGTIVIPAALQKNDNWRQQISDLAEKNNIDLLSIASGLTIAGIDIGSSSMVPIDKVKVLLVGGQGSSQYEAAEVLYYLDASMSVPVSVVERSRLTKIDFSSYTHIVMVDGNYQSLLDSTVKKITSWVKNGGVIIGQKRAARWLSDNDLLKVKFVKKEHLDKLFDTNNLSYDDKERLSARKRIAGAIFESTIDLSHPLVFGYTDNRLPLFRNSTIIMEQSNIPFLSVANYSSAPLLSGYSDSNLVNKIADQPAIVAHNLGRGRVIATTDNLTFRGYWHGSAKILANSIFFAKAFSVSVE